MTTFVKTGGSFRIGVKNPDTGQIDSYTKPQQNKLLNVGVRSLFEGLPDYLPIQIGDSVVPTDPTLHTGVVNPIGLEINDITTSNVPVISEMPFDPSRILIVTGKSTFKVEVLEAGILNEVAIENFCRAVVDEPIMVEVGNELVIEYTFNIFLNFNSRDSFPFNGAFIDPDTQEIRTYNSRTATVTLNQTAPYAWTELLSTFNHAFTISDVANIHDPENVRIPVDLLDTTVHDTSRDTWITVNGPSLPTGSIGGLYFGNKHFGMITTFYEIETFSIKPLPIPSQQRISLLFKIDWSNQEL